MEAVLKEFRSTADDAANETVSSLPEFKRALTALETYLKPMKVRHIEEVQATLSQLGRELEKYKNGAGWIKYLSFPEGFKLSEAKDSAEITKLLKRFDKLAADGNYKKVTDQPSFNGAHAALRTLLESSTEEASE